MKQCCRLLLWFLAFLLPLKFGAFAVSPVTTSYFPEDLFSWAIVTWPGQSFGIAGGVALLLAAIAWPMPKISLRNGSLGIALGFLVLLPLAALPGFLRASCAEYPILTLAHLAGIGCAVTAFAIAAEADEIFRKGFFSAVAAGVLILGVLGAQQYFTGFEEQARFLAEQQKATGAETLYSQALTGRILDTRIFATFTGCNALAGFLLLTIPVTIYTISRWSLRFEPRKWSKLLFCGTAIVLLAGVFLGTKSRGGFLTAILMAGGTFFLLPLRRRWKVLAASLLGCVILAGAWYIGQRGRGFGSMAERIDYLRSGVIVLCEQPLAGTGWGDFMHEHMKLKKLPGTEAANDPHSLLTAFASQSGIFGLLGVLALTGMIFFVLFRRFKSGETTDEKIFFAALLWGTGAFFVHALMDMDWLVPCSMTLWGALAAVGAAKPDSRKEAPERSKFSGYGMRIFFGAAGILTVCFAWNLVASEKAFDQLIAATSAAQPNDGQVILLYQKAQQMRQSSPFPAWRAGDYFLQHRQYAMAEQFFEKAQQLLPERSSLHYRRYLTARARGDFAAAKAHLEAAHKAFPKHPDYQPEQ
ncbi:MAG: O-antigen ligase family protein [Victivallaceae bacterium]|nr:O-antigen ligase family protein [Victivallaceae bacterium]